MQNQQQMKWAQEAPQLIVANADLIRTEKKDSVCRTARRTHAQCG